VRHLAVQGAAAAAGRVRPSSSSSATAAAGVAAGGESVARQHAALANRHASWMEVTVRPALLAALGVLCKTWMHGLNTTTVHGGDRLHQALQQRQHGQGLVRIPPTQLDGLGEAKDARTPVSPATTHTHTNTHTASGG
jgi:hypothetical protein